MLNVLCSQLSIHRYKAWRASIFFLLLLLFLGRVRGVNTFELIFNNSVWWLWLWWSLEKVWSLWCSRALKLVLLVTSNASLCFHGSGNCFFMAGGGSKSGVYWSNSAAAWCRCLRHSKEVDRKDGPGFSYLKIITTLIVWGENIIPHICQGLSGILIHQTSKAIVASFSRAMKFLKILSC